MPSTLTSRPGIWPGIKKCSISDFCSWSIAALIAVVIMLETFDLTVFPVVDTGLWFGDESWTMATLMSMAQHGVARVPEAIGSSLAISNGFVNGSVWIAAVLYGIPAMLLRSIASPVVAGRMVSLLVVLITLVSVYRLSIRIGATRLQSVFAIFLLVVSPGFHLLSHSARLDALTGLAVILALAFYHSLIERNTASHEDFLLIGASLGIGLAVYVHVPTLLAAPALWTLWRLKPDWKAVLSTAVGGLLSVAALAGIYWMTTGEFFLFGKSGTYNQYYNVIHSIPALHPFSLAVQHINTIDRFYQVDGLAPLIVALLVLGLALNALFWKRITLSASQPHFLWLALLTTLSWMAFEGPAVFYNLHALPVFTVCGAIALTIVWQVLPKAAGNALLPIVALAIAIYTAATSLPMERHRASVGEAITEGNRTAIAALLGPITASDSSRPIVLTDEPGYDAIMANPHFRLMTKHLLLFGGEEKPLAEILHEHHVQYLMLYSTWRWQSPVRPVADSLYTLIGEQRGMLTDQARGYDNPDNAHEDTLRLYHYRQ